MSEQVAQSTIKTVANPYMLIIYERNIKKQVC